MSRPGLIVAAISLLMLSGSAMRAPAQDTGAEPYLRGLDALQNGDYKDAVQAFSAAIETDSENADFYFARGVANLLAEKIEPAKKDLSRAMKLGDASNKHYRLWMAACERMSGNIFSETYPQSTHDAYESMVGFGSAMYGDVKQRLVREPDYPPGPAEMQQANDWIPKAAKEFASRMKGSAGGAAAAADVAPALAERARQLFEEGNFAEALVDFNNVLKARPDAIDIVFLRARCLAELNDWTEARQQYTRVLCAQPARGQGYLHRALSAAKMGNVQRAKEDLELAKKYGASELESLAPEIEKTIDTMKQEAQTDPATFLAALEAAARGNEPWKQIVAAARKVHQSADARRLRLDETYQLRLRELNEQVNANPNSADALAELATYMNHQVHPWGGRVEPRAPFEKFRDFDFDRELADAEALADRALAIDANHAQALVTKAHIRIRHQQFADAENLLEKAMGIRDDIPEMLDLYAGIMASVANVNEQRALALRTPRSWSETHDEGDWRVTYYYTRYPSADELALADQLKTQAGELFKMAEQYMQRMIQLRAGTADGFYYQGEFERWNNRLDAARAAMEQAVQLDPKHVNAWQALSEIYSNLDQPDKALEAHSRGSNVLHTNAIGQLRIAWNKINKTAYKSANAALDAAQALDPSDARIYAYRAVIAQQEEKLDDAIAYFRMALAMEDARLRVRGTPLPTREKSRAIADPQQVGLALACGVRAGELLSANGKPADAADVLRLVAELQGRLTQEQWQTRLHTSMLPDQVSPDDPNFVPEAMPASTWLASANVSLAKMAIEQGKQKKAQTFYESAVALAAPGEPGALARIGLATLYLDDKRFDDAIKVLQSNTTGRFSPEIQRQLNELNMRIAREMN